MRLLDRVLRPFAYPAQAPALSLTLYYALLLGVAGLLFWLLPDVRQAFSGERLIALAGDGMSLPNNPGPAQGATLSAHFALLLGVAMLGAFLLMVPTSWVYMATRRRKGFNQDVVHTMVILALSVAGVVVIVRNSLALAFSLAGIVGAVRFRNSLPDTRDTLYIFLAIGVGLAAGVEALAAALVLSVVFNYIVLFLWQADYGMCDLRRPTAHLLQAAPIPPSGNGKKEAEHAAHNGKHAKDRKPFDSVLVVRARDAAPARALVEPFLARASKRWELAEQSHDPKAGESVLRYRLRLGKSAEPEALEDALLEVSGDGLLGVRVT